MKDRIENQPCGEILERMIDGFLFLDRDGRVAYMNSAAERLLRRKREDLIGRNLWEEFPEAVGTRFYTEYLRVVSQQVEVSYEEYYPPFNVWAEVNAYPSAEGIAVFLRDITRRVEAEQALSAISSASFEGVVIHVGGVIVELNDAYAELLGYEPSELRGRNLLDLMPPESREIVKEKLAQGYQGAYEIVGQRRDGATFIAEIRGKNITYRGRPARATSARDITERKKAEEELLRSRELLETVLGTVPTGVVFADTDGNITYFSPGAVKIFGGPVTGTAAGPEPGTYQLLKPDGSPFPSDELPLVRTVRENTPISNVEIRVRRADGQEIEILAGSNPVHDAEGRITGAVVSLTDITELRKAQKELLEQERRTSQLLQRALLPTETPVICSDYVVAATYIPGVAGYEIGGDFYDIFETETGRTGIVIGDVSGKGIPAASLAAAARSTIRAFAYDMSRAEEAMSHTNSVLCSQTEIGAFVTMFLAILEPASGRICYSSAGHPPPVIYRRGGGVEVLSGRNIPAGILAKYHFTEAESIINPGDKIVLYTDGLSEARSDSCLFGTDGIEHVLAEHGEESPEAIMRELLAAASTWAEGAVRDDTAIVVIERVPLRSV